MKNSRGEQDHAMKKALTKQEYEACAAFFFNTNNGNQDDSDAKRLKALCRENMEAMKLVLVDLIHEK